MEGCERVLDSAPPSDLSILSIKRKVYSRLLRSYKALGKYNEAMQAFESMKLVNIDIENDEQFRRLKNEISAERTKYGGNDEPWDIPPMVFSSHASLAPPMPSGAQLWYTYQVRVAGHVQNFQERAAESLCVANPPEMAAYAHQTLLCKKHEVDLRAAKSYDCSVCGKPDAMSILHNPVWFLHKSPRCLVDLARPVCSTGGVCERKAMPELEVQRRELAGSWPV